MPIYTFHCSPCDKNFDTYLSMGMGKWTWKELKAQPKDSAPCPLCNSPSQEKVISKDLYFIGTSVQSAEFNPGLGCVVKNKRHKQDLLKAKNLVEVGNDFNSGEKHQKHFEARKKQEMESNWKNIVGEAEVS